MRRRVKDVVYASHAEYIDPADCGSTVGYSISSRRHLNAVMDLADCSHKITWNFENENSAVAKIDKAIAILVKFKADFVAARKKFGKNK